VLLLLERESEVARVAAVLVVELLDRLTL